VEAHALTTTECSLLSALLRRRSLRSAAGAVDMSPPSAVRLIQRLETKNGARLIAGGPSGPVLTPRGRVLLRASVDLHDWLGAYTTTNRSSHHPVRLASALESHMDVDQLARLDPPLVVDVTETDGAHAIELFDSGSSDALALWHVPGAAAPARDAVAAPLFDEDLWVVGRDVPAAVRSIEELTEALEWTTTSSQADLFASLLRIRVDSPRVQVVESRHAHRILILSGRAAGLVPASHREEYERLGLTHVRPRNLTRQAMLYMDARCQVHDRLGEIQGMFRDRMRRMSSPEVVAPRPAAPPTGPTPCLDLGEVAVLRAIGQHGSLNRAAADLCLTQPAVTRRLRRLEEKASTTLVMRTATGSSLTQEAVRIIQHVDVALSRFQASVSAAYSDTTSPWRPLRGGPFRAENLGPAVR
jgi:DNA-binding transcriptional LysR family regulator